MKTENMKPYVICTNKRGVFYGYADEDELTNNPKPKIYNARMVLYWSSDCCGVVGLAARGPIGDSRITPAVEDIVLHEPIEATFLCSDYAAKLFDKFVGGIAIGKDEPFDRGHYIESVVNDLVAEIELNVDDESVITDDALIKLREAVSIVADGISKK